MTFANDEKELKAVEADDEGEEGEEEDEDEELASLTGSGIGAVSPVNYEVGVGAVPSNSSNNSRSATLERHASMACMWHTTVPQSLTPFSEQFGRAPTSTRSKSKSSSGDRHAPTRRSLRHSRMLVTSKHQRSENCKEFGRAATTTVLYPTSLGEMSSTSSEETYSDFGTAGGTCLIVSQLLVGVSLVATFAAFVARSPFWADTLAPDLSGVLVCLSSCTSLPLVLRRNCHNGSGRRKESSNFHSSYVVLSFMLSLIASLCCLFSFAVLSFHLYRLFVAVPRCSLERPLSAGGVGQRDLLPSFHSPWISKDVNSTVISCQCGNDLWYPGLPCDDVRKFLPPTLTATSALNFAGFFLGVWLTAAIIAFAQQQRRRMDRNMAALQEFESGRRRRRQSA